MIAADVSAVAHDAGQFSKILPVISDAPRVVDLSVRARSVIVGAAVFRDSITGRS